MQLDVNQVEFLKQVAVNSVANQPSYVSREAGFALMQGQYIQINNEQTDGQGNFLCWLTELGSQVANQAAQPQMVQPRVDAKDPSAARDEVTGKHLPQPTPNQQVPPTLPTFDPNQQAASVPPVNPGVDQMIQATSAQPSQPVQATAQQPQQPQFNPNQQQLPAQTVVAQPQVATQPQVQQQATVGNSLPQQTQVVPNNSDIPIATGIAVPATSPTQQSQKKSQKSDYPFDSLQIGGCFFVAHSEVKKAGKEQTQDAVRTMRSNANRHQRGYMVYKVDSVDAQGNRVYIQEKKKNGDLKVDKKNQPIYEKICTRRFSVYAWTVKPEEVESLGNKYPAGTEGAMIFRVALEPTDRHNCQIDG